MNITVKEIETLELEDYESKLLNDACDLANRIFQKAKPGGKLEQIARGARDNIEDLLDLDGE